MLSRRIIRYAINTNKREEKTKAERRKESPAWLDRPRLIILSRVRILLETRWRGSALWTHSNLAQERYTLVPFLTHPSRRRDRAMRNTLTTLNSSQASEGGVGCYKPKARQAGGAQGVSVLEWRPDDGGPLLCPSKLGNEIGCAGGAEAFLMWARRPRGKGRGEECKDTKPPLREYW